VWWITRIYCFGTYFGPSLLLLLLVYLIVISVRFDPIPVFHSSFPADGDVLMAIPELYLYGREGTHFGLGMFTWYMLDAVVQVGG
jgi:hypothetical protein